MLELCSRCAVLRIAVFQGMNAVVIQVQGSAGRNECNRIAVEGASALLGGRVSRNDLTRVAS